MDRQPKIEDALEVLTKEAEQYHVLESNEETPQDVKNKVFEIFSDFSYLEESLESFLYSLYSDRGSSVGILETEDFNVSKKIKTLKRKLKLVIKELEIDIEYSEVDRVVDLLINSSRIRNTLAHIKWHTLFSIDGYKTNEDGEIEYEAPEDQMRDLYFHKYKLKDYELRAEYVNCSIKRLNIMEDYINFTHNRLSELQEEYELKLAEALNRRYHH